MDIKFLIIGRTSSGKDCLVNYICKEYGLKQLKSYATRPKRYDCENTHIFITPQESASIQSNAQIIAYTKIGKYEYFGTYEQLLESDLYIIDPNGAKYLKDNYKTQLIARGIKLVTFYIYTDDNIRFGRAMNRCDDYKAYEKRCADEQEQFDKMELETNYDHFICNDYYESSTLGIDSCLQLYNINKIIEKEGKSDEQQ